MAHQCGDCQLYEDVESICVGYDGPENPRILIVGEAPGKQEDEEGRPFVGPSGQLLEELIEKMGIPLEDVAFANIVRCVPWAIGKVGNKVRPPTDKEVEGCEHYLIADLESVGPEVLIVPVGNTALNYFTGRKAITKARGNIYEFKIDAYEQPFEVMPTVHPASVLYDPHGPKGQFYYSAILEDLAKAREHVYGTSQLSYEGYELIFDIEQLEQVVDDMLSRYASRVKLGGDTACMCVDVETGPEGYGLRPFSEEGFLISIGFTDTPGQAWTIPLHHDDSPFTGDAAAMSAISAQMQRLFDTIPVVNHNIKFDYQWLREKGGMVIKHVLGDTYLQSWTLYNKTELHGLEYLSAKFLGIAHHKKEMSEALAALPDGMKDMSHVPLDTLIRYNGMDVDVALQLYFYFANELREIGLDVVDQEYMPDAVEPFADMERNGVALDTEIFEAVDKEYLEDLDALTQWFVDGGYPGEVAEFNVDKKGNPRPFKLSATNVVKALLYDVIQLPVVNKTKGGEPATDKDTLIAQRIKLQESLDRPDPNIPQDQIEEWRKWATQSVEVIDKIREHRKTSKLYTSYVKPIPTFVESDGLIHPSYGIRTTETGRRTAVRPAFQTFPRKSPVRDAFVSRWRNEGGLLLSPDYSQMELRVLAMLSGDESLMAAFAAGKDIHRATAAIINNISEDEVTTEQRTDAKRGSFGVVYGQTPHGMSKKHGISMYHAETIIDGMLETYPGVRDYQQKMEDEARSTGMVYTPTGHRRLLPDATRESSGGRHDEDREHALRAATNTPIQGGASDIMEQVLIHLWYEQMYPEGVLYGYESLMVGDVHDSLLYDAFPGELYALMSILRVEMEDWPQSIFSDWMTVPLKIDFEVGPSWGKTISTTLADEDGVLIMDGNADTFYETIGLMDLWSTPPALLESKEYIDNDERCVEARVYFPGH